MDSPNNEDRKKWQGTVGDAPAGSSKGKRVFILTAILAALAAAVVALLLLMGGGDSPHFLTLSIREYKDELWPTNPFAVQDGALLMRHFPEEKANSPYEKQSQKLILRAMEELPHDGISPIVIRLCAHAASKNGDVFLIPGEAKPDQPGGWIPLNNILDLLQNHKARSKLLILDVARLHPKMRLGSLHRDVAARIQSMLEKRENDDALAFFVLTACSAGQHSLVVDHLQQSALAYFLDRGLSGDADGWIDDRKDDSITVRELAAFVEKHVDFWAGANRNVRQSPRLFGKCGDFQIVRLDPAAERKQPPKTKRRTYPAWLAQGWKQRDDWRKQQLYLFAPRPFQLFESLLHRAEERWHNGIEYDPKKKDQKNRVKDEFTREARALETQMQHALAFTTYSPHSIALARSFRKLPAWQPDSDSANPEQKTESNKTPNDKQKPTGDAKAKEQPKGEKKGETKPKAAAVDPQKEFELLIAKFDRGEISVSDKKALLKAHEEFAKFWKKVAALPMEDVAHVVMEYAALPLPLKQDRVRFLFELLGASDKKRPFAETLIIDRLERWRKQVVDIGWPWSNDAARLAVVTSLRAEKVVVMLHQNPEALPWVRDAMIEADDSRRKGEASLFSGLPPDLKKGISALSQAEQAFLRIEGTIKTVADAYSVYGRALIDLPAYVPTFVRMESLEQIEKDAWLNAIRQTLALHDLLKKPSTANLDPISSAQITLRDSLFRLASFFRGHVDEALTGERITASALSHQNAVLQSLRLAADERIQLWQRIATIGRKLHRNALGNANVLTNEIPKTEVNSTSPSEISNRRWDQTFRRAWFHVQLLKLAGLNQQSLEDRLAEIRDVRKVTEWRAFEDDLAAAWNIGLPKQYKESKSEPFDLVRLSYFYTWYNVNREWADDPFHWSHNPAVSLHRGERDAFWSWLADRCRRENEATAKWRPKTNLFSNAATQYSR